MGRPAPGSGALGAAAGQFNGIGVEVVQTVQEPQNSVSLIAAKHTLVRVYFDSELSLPLTLRGVLRLNGALDVASQNQTTIDPSDNGRLEWRRRDLQRSLNFVVPTAVAAEGDLDIALHQLFNANTGESLDFAGETETTVAFRSAPNLRLRLIGIRYRKRFSSVYHQPRQLDIDLIVSWLRRAYPVADVDFSYRLVDSNWRWPFSASNINSQLAAIRQQEVANGIDSRTHYYGLVHDGVGSMMRGRASAIPGTPNPAAVASGPAGAHRYAWDTDGSYADWYCGHELAHTFGRNHPGFCNGNSHHDPSFPYPHGRISGSNPSYVGYDRGDATHSISPAALPGDQWHDVMTYCENQWLSAYCYEGILTRLIAEDGLAGAPAAAPAAAAGSGAMNHVNIVATLNLTQASGKFEFVNPVNAAVDNAAANAKQEPAPAYTASLRMLDAKGGQLGQEQVDISLASCADAGADEEGLVNAVVAVADNVSAIELLLNDRVVDRFESGPSPSEVAALRSAPGNIAGAMDVHWDSAQAADPKITYTVQISTDQGASWETIAIGRPTPNVQLDRTLFPDVEAVDVRVIATNGFRAARPIESQLRFD